MLLLHTLVEMTLTLVGWIIGIPVAMVSVWLKKPLWLLSVAFLCTAFFHSSWLASAFLATVIVMIYSLSLHAFHSAKLSYEDRQDKKFKKRVALRRVG